MAEVRTGRGYVYTIQFHLVFAVKYRRKVLMDDVAHDLKCILYQIAEDHGISIVEIETDKDYVHMVIECKPQHYIPNFVKAFKGVSARLLFKKHPGIKAKLWGGHLWNPSYFVATVSENTEAQVRQYIQSQKER